ncbi:MAG: hypothetical protein ACJ706_02170 [Nitrososphaeraceae archaeon]
MPIVRLSGCTWKYVKSTGSAVLKIGIEFGLDSLVRYYSEVGDGFVGKCIIVPSL